MLGGKYVFANTRVTNFGLGLGLAPSEVKMINSGLGFISEYESFNKVLSPSKGLRVHLSYTQFLEFLGSKVSSGKASLFSLGYIPIIQRWSLVGFAGYGVTYKLDGSLQKASSAWNAGGGFRYLIARALGLQMGLDVARGPEDWAFYLVFGSSWTK